MTNLECTFKHHENNRVPWHTAPQVCPNRTQICTVEVDAALAVLYQASQPQDFSHFKLDSSLLLGISYAL